MNASSDDGHVHAPEVDGEMYVLEDAELDGKESAEHGRDVSRTAFAIPPVQAKPTGREDDGPADNACAGAIASAKSRVPPPPDGVDPFHYYALRKQKEVPSVFFLSLADTEATKQHRILSELEVAADTEKKTSIPTSTTSHVPQVQPAPSSSSSSASSSASPSSSSSASSVAGCSASGTSAQSAASPPSVGVLTPLTLGAKSVSDLMVPALAFFAFPTPAYYGPSYPRFVHRCFCRFACAQFVLHRAQLLDSLHRSRCSVLHSDTWIGTAHSPAQLYTFSLASFLHHLSIYARVPSSCSACRLRARALRSRGRSGDLLAVVHAHGAWRSCRSWLSLPQPVVDAVLSSLKAEKLRPFTAGCDREQAGAGAHAADTLGTPTSRSPAAFATHSPSRSTPSTSSESSTSPLLPDSSLPIPAGASLLCEPTATAAPAVSSGEETKHASAAGSSSPSPPPGPESPDAVPFDFDFFWWVSWRKLGCGGGICFLSRPSRAQRLLDGEFCCLCRLSRRVVSDVSSAKHGAINIVHHSVRVGAVQCSVLPPDSSPSPSPSFS